MSDLSPIRASDLLRLLEPAVRPAFPGPAASFSVPATLDAQSFETMLASAQRGEIRSDQPLTMACDLQPPLSESQALRLSHAADRALVGGCTRALMLLDGRPLVVDVASRSVLHEVAANAPMNLLAVDGALVVSSNESPSPPGSPFAGLNTLAVNAVLRRSEAQDPHVSRQLSPARPATSR